MWTTETVMTWLTGLGLTVPVINGAGTIPDMPDRICVVTPIPGVGLALEGVADTPGFQVRMRGSQNQPDDAENLALDADRRILGAALPAAVGTTHLVWVTRSGGRPAPLSAAPDDGGRTEFVCTYLARILEAP
jgi:hypothetical protein